VKQRRKPFYRVWFLALWLVFTVALTVWWLIFGQRQLTLISEAGFQSSADLLRSHRMLLMEGATLVVSLIGGALAFYLLGLRERKQSDAIQQFLMTFTHELKTPIASLRLQAEELSERLKESKERGLLDRLVTDTSRLTLQLDNSLFLAAVEQDQLIPETIVLSDIVELMRAEWPALKITAKGDALIIADKRALLSIFRNLFHNGVVHGKASQIEVQVLAASKPNQVEISVTDNGRGFQGDVDKVAKLLKRHYSGSGSGIGLHLVGKLTKLLGGTSRPKSISAGFGFIIELPGQLKAREI
jgi:signal transduction histidine kinase